MNWLLWREFRLNRLIIITGLVLLLLPYVIALIVVGWMAIRPVSSAPPTIGIFGGAAVYSIILSQFTLGLLGGNAIAGERADRSAEFVAYLPLSRSRRLASKLGLSLIVVFVMWTFTFLVGVIIWSRLPDMPAAHRARIPIQTVYIAITGMVFFGVAWLISSVQSSPTFAVCGGLITPLIIVMCIQAVAWLVDMSQMQEFLSIGYPIICPLLAILCFLIGSVCFLRRIEP